MNYVELLRKKAKETGSIVCMGMDPFVEKIPIKGSPKEIITKFYIDILTEMKKQNIFPGCVKPNLPFYEQYGNEGLDVLRLLIAEYKKAGLIVILDAKRSDIGNTTAAYVKAIYSHFNPDAITVQPYLGIDSIDPFLNVEGKGTYVLQRTSNPSATEIQDLKVEGTPIYMKIGELIIKWYKPGIGSVVGATYHKELEQISKFFVDSGKEIPMLIPGVGKQGGSAQDVMEALRKTKNDPAIHRINSSSGINFAYEKEGTKDYAGAAVRAIKELNDEIGFE